MIEWVEKYNYILEQVEGFRESEPEIYKEYYRRIARERLLPLFILSYHYGEELRAEDKLMYRTQFKSDCLLFGETLLGSSPNALLADLYITWGI